MTPSCSSLWVWVGGTYLQFSPRKEPPSHPCILEMPTCPGTLSPHLSSLGKKWKLWAVRERGKCGVVDHFNTWRCVSCESELSCGKDVHLTISRAHNAGPDPSHDPS
ncbi:uncharacterized [Tachysurus ichikawai]